MLAVRRASVVVFTLHEKLLLTSLYKAVKRASIFVNKSFSWNINKNLTKQQCPNAIPPGQNYSPQDEYKYCSEKIAIIKSTNCQKEGSPSPFSHTCEVFDPIACKGRSLQLLIRLRAFSRSRVASTSHVRVSHQLGVMVTFPGPDS